MSIDDNIVGTIWNSKISQDILENLCSIGSRSSLTESEIKGKDFLKDRLTSYKLDKIYLEELEYQGWSPGQTSVELTNPIKKKIDAVSNIQCPSTSCEGIEGEIIFLESGTPSIFYKNEIVRKKTDF